MSCIRIELFCLELTVWALMIPAWGQVTHHVIITCQWYVTAVIWCVPCPRAVTWLHLTFTVVLLHWTIVGISKAELFKWTLIFDLSIGHWDVHAVFCLWSLVTSALVALCWDTIMNMTLIGSCNYRWTVLLLCALLINHLLCQCQHVQIIIISIIQDNI